MHWTRAGVTTEPTLATQVIPTQLGRYRLCFRIATGGMATVYLARVDGGVGLQLLVALKRIHPHLAGAPGFVEMFLDEARIASRIRHPNVCSVYDFEAKGALSFIVMEYLMGEPLIQVLRALARTEPVGLRAAVRIAKVIADACEGLHAAHELQSPTGEPLDIVHRDVSPQNLFLTYEGMVKVVDFGVASAALRTHETQTGMLKGKLAYLPPEALAGKRPDRRGDVWGLGVVLWELLTGHRLFLRASDAETVRALAEPIVKPSELARGVPGSIDAIVLKALARNPDERYATARDLGKDLLRFVNEQGLAIGPAELSEWMDELFPVGRACQRQLLDVAAQMDPVLDPMPDEEERTRARASTVTPARRSSPRRRPSKSGTTLAVVAAGLAMMLAVGAAAVAVTRGPSSRPAVSGVGPTTSAPAAHEGPACEPTMVQVPPSVDPYVLQIWPEIGEDGRVTLRVQPTNAEARAEEKTRSSRRSRGRPQATEPESTSTEATPLLPQSWHGASDSR